MFSHQRISLPALLLLFLLAATASAASVGTTPEADEGLLSKAPRSMKDVVSIRTAWSVNAIRPGDRFALAVILDVEPGYHIIADDRQITPIADFTPYPTRVTVVDLPDGLLIEEPIYPEAHGVSVEFTSEPFMVFDRRTVIYFPVVVTRQASPDDMRISVVVTYQACDDQVCLFPREIAVPVTLPPAAEGKIPQKINPNIFDDYDRAEPERSQDTVGFSLFGLKFAISTVGGWGLVLLLVTAALGGVLLNLTPCVLPLIPIKIMSLSNACQNRRRCFALGIFMFLGVIFFWLALGATMSLASGFTATNQLFQYPVFTILIGVVIAVMAIGMGGFFSIPLPNVIYRLNPAQDTLTGSFGIGVLTAILSTPCTAPFMGAAAAWATSQHPLTTLTVFASIGTGMALPYLVLSAFPEWAGRMPRTGPASDLVKQVMGIFLLAAAAYFIGSGISAWRMTPPVPPGQGYWWVVMGFVASGGLWLAYRTVRMVSGRLARISLVLIGVLLATGSVYAGLRLTDRGPIDWVYYTPQRFQEARENNKIIVMVFTAEWCLNCKALEQSVLYTDTIAQLLASEDIAPIKVDITGHNEPGRRKLQEVGQLTIPLLIVYTPSGKELFRGDFYTAEQIADAVKRARKENKPIDS